MSGCVCMGACIEKCLQIYTSDLRKNILFKVCVCVRAHICVCVCVYVCVCVCNRGWCVICSACFAFPPTGGMREEQADDLIAADRGSGLAQFWILDENRFYSSHTHTHTHT